MSLHYFHTNNLKYNTSSVIKIDLKRRHKGKENGQFKTLTSIKYAFQIFEDHLDAIRDNSKQLRRLPYIGSMGETRSGKMTSEIRWSHGSLTNKKEVSEDTRYQGGGIIHG